MSKDQISQQIKSLGHCNNTQETRFHSNKEVKKWKWLLVQESNTTMTEFLNMQQDGTNATMYSVIMVKNDYTSEE